MAKNDYLTHWGIKGQKWGIRRYQNEDGTLTALGRERVMDKSSGSYEKMDDTRQQHYANKTLSEQVDRDWNNRGSALNSASNAARNAKELNDNLAKREREKAKSQMDLSSMSDEELRAAINRMNMERQYKEMTTETSKGRASISDILSTIGSVVAIGSSVVGIITAVNGLKSGNSEGGGSKKSKDDDHITVPS